MTQEYEYQIVPAPTRRARLTGLVAGEDAFSVTLGDVVNSHAKQGWEYVRKDSLAETRGTWPFRRRGAERDLLVFRRRLKITLEPRSDLDVEAARARRVRREDLVAKVSAGARKFEFGSSRSKVAAE